MKKQLLVTSTTTSEKAAMRKTKSKENFCKQLASVRKCSNRKSTITIKNSTQQQIKLTVE